MYRSRAASSLTWHDVRDMVEHSRSRNAHSGVTGILLMARQEFVQALEGPVTTVRAIYRSICNDSRHYDVDLIAFEHDVSPLFAAWSMHGISLDALGEQDRTRLITRYHVDQGDRFMPSSAEDALGLMQYLQRTCCDATTMIVQRAAPEMPDPDSFTGLFTTH